MGYSSDSCSTRARFRRRGTRAVGVARDPEAGGIQQRGHVLVAVGHVAVGVPRIGHTYRPDRRRIPAAT